MSKSDLENKILKILSKQELDLRKTKYRFMDQKVTPDVLNFICDCIENLEEKKKKNFTKNDIWESKYFAENIKVIYNKKIFCLFEEKTIEEFCQQFAQFKADIRLVQLVLVHFYLRAMGAGNRQSVIIIDQLQED